MIQVHEFRRIVFFTGAGMSAESGVPTYRGKGGIWKDYDYENCACQEAFDRDPEYVWEFHNYRRGLVSKCSPNSGHELIARCEAVLPEVAVVTQNIDGLHQQAGSQRVLELHGSLWRVRCDHCGWNAEERTSPLQEFKCPRCGQGNKRPDIVWFGDMLSAPILGEVEALLLRCDLLVSIGTSAVVHPAAQLPLLARQANAVLVEINPEQTPISDAYDHCVREGASQALAKMCQGLPAAPV